MSSSIHWNPLLPLVPLGIAAVVVAAVLVFLELRRRQKFKWLRVACQVVVVASMFGLLLRPSIESPSPSQPLLILTEGFDPARVDSLVGAYPGLALYCMPGADDYKTARRLADARQLKLLRGEPVWIIGNGLPYYALPEISLDFRYLAGPPVNGVTYLNFRGKGTAERWNTIDGTYFSSIPRRRTVRLLGPGGLEDSVAITTSGSTGFALSYFPKVGGRIVYKLEEMDSTGQVLHSNSLPVTIDAERKLNIVFINDYPSFEQRYLKNFLASKGHSVAIRNRVSNDRYHQEFSNRAPRSLNTLSSALLDETDLLIVDQRSFQAAANSEQRSIREAMEKGLGVLLLADEKSKGDQLITFEEIAPGRDTVRLSLGKEGSFTLPAATIRPTADIIPLLQSTDGRIVTGCVCSGRTKTGFQLLRETFQVGLEGKTGAYASIWSPLLERIARKAHADFEVAMRTPFPWYSNEPVDFDVISSGAIPDVLFDNMELPLREDSNIEALWHGRLWADGNKWHTANFNDTDSVAFSLYDLPADEWRALNLARQVEANKNHSVKGRPLGTTNVTKDNQLPAVLFLLFVLSSGFLWLAPKI
jgi:hypothetical protein